MSFPGAGIHKRRSSLEDGFNEGDWYLLFLGFIITYLLIYLWTDLMGETGNYYCYCLHNSISFKESRLNNLE